MTTTDSVPKAKQTHLGLYVTARDAYETWKTDPDKVTILDVRTPEELLFVGHLDMAWKIPVFAQSYDWDAARETFPMRTLPDFVQRVRRIAGPDDTIMVMCRSGSRSGAAVNLLAEAGFTRAFQIVDGFEGGSGQPFFWSAHEERLEKLSLSLDGPADSRAAAVAGPGTLMSGTCRPEAASVPRAKHKVSR